MFQTLQLINVYDQPSLKGAIIGQLALGQQFGVVETPQLADGWIWHRIEGEGVLWIQEKSENGATLLLQWVGTTPAPQIASAKVGDSSPKATQTQAAVRSLPENIDLDPNDYDRTFLASLNITRAFEGGSYASYNNYDRGIVSYGIMQFTLSSGSLGRVMDKYFSRASSPAAESLKNEYLLRIQNKDQGLRNDTRFKELLKQAAQDSEMKDAQFEVAQTDYWEVVLKNYVQRRGNIRLPLTYALLFDMGINFGVNHAYVRLAEEALGVPSNSRPGDNGITEQQLTSKVAELRRDSHYRQAERDNLPGLKVRGDFWVKLTQSGDWYLQGDGNGLVVPKSGVQVQTRNPVMLDR